MKKIAAFFLLFMFLLPIFQSFANGNSTGGFNLDGLNFEVINNSGGNGNNGGESDKDWGTLDGNKVYEKDDDEINGKKFKKEELSDIISKKIQSLENTGIEEIQLFDLTGNGIPEIIGKKYLDRHVSIRDKITDKSRKYLGKDYMYKVYYFNGISYVNGTELDKASFLDVEKGGIEFLNFKKGKKNNLLMLELNWSGCKDYYVNEHGYNVNQTNKEIKSQNERNRYCINDIEKRFFDEILYLKLDGTYSTLYNYIKYFNNKPTFEKQINDGGSKIYDKGVSFFLKTLDGKIIGKTIFKNLPIQQNNYLDLNVLEKSITEDNIILYEKHDENFYFENGFGYLRNSNGVFEKYSYIGVENKFGLIIRDFQYVGISGEENDDKLKNDVIYNDDGKIIGSVNDQLLVSNNQDGTKNYSIVVDSNGEEKIILMEKSVHGAFFEDFDGDGIKEAIFYENYENDSIGMFKIYRIYKYKDGKYEKIVNKKKGFNLEIVEILGGSKKNLLIQGIDGNLNIYDQDIKLIKSIKSNEATFKDVNFDGKNDLITKQHIKGLKNVGYIQIYLFDENSGEFIKTLTGNGVVGEYINISNFDIDENGVKELEVHKQDGIKLMKYEKNNNSYSNIGDGMTIKKGGFKKYIEKNDEKFGKGNTGYITPDMKFMIIGKDLKQKLKVATFDSYTNFGSCVNEGCKDKFKGIKNFFIIGKKQNLLHISQGESSEYNFSKFSDPNGTNNLLISKINGLFSVAFNGGKGEMKNITSDKKYIFIPMNGQILIIRTDFQGLGFGKEYKEVGSFKIFSKNGKILGTNGNPKCYHHFSADDGGILYSKKIMDSSFLDNEENYKRFMSINGSLKFVVFGEKVGENKYQLYLKIGGGKKQVIAEHNGNFVDGLHETYTGSNYTTTIKISKFIEFMKDPKNKKEYDKFIQKKLAPEGLYFYYFHSGSCYTNDVEARFKEGKDGDRSGMDDRDIVNSQSLNRWFKTSPSSSDNPLEYSMNTRIRGESVLSLSINDMLNYKTGWRLEKNKYNIKNEFK